MDKNILWQSALAGVGLAVGIAFLILPILAIWAGMLYLTQIILGINFLPPDYMLGDEPSLTLVMVTIAIIGEGTIAFLVWEKTMEKIVKWIK